MVPHLEALADVRPTRRRPVAKSEESSVVGGANEEESAVATRNLTMGTVASANTHGAHDCAT
jgi:hypothetical protein